MGGDTVTADPTRSFQAEHAEALAALRRLEAAALALDAGAPPDGHLAAVREALTVLTTAVRRHNENEEMALFPLLEGLAPTTLFIEEHRHLRALEERLGRELERTGSRRLLATLACEIVDLLRAHIAREDEVLFPMARSLLGPDGLAMVAQRLGLGDEHA